LICTLLACSCGGATSTGLVADEAEYEALRARAVALHESGDDPAGARTALEAALALRPEHYGLNQRLGRVCLDLRLNEQALEALERALAARPEERRALLSIISLQVTLGQFDAALTRIPQVVDDPELRGEALYLQAHALEQTGKREAAREVAQASRTLAPERSYRCQALLGRMALEDGDHAKAHAYFERARVGRPDYREALKGLADSARRLGREAEADRWDHLLGLYLQLNDSAFARAPAQADARRALLETLISIYPDWSAGFEETAELQRAQGDKAAACATMEIWLAKHGADMPPGAKAALHRRYCDEAP
jgi:tetratricopeptide (TPR) repeat protein